MDGKFIPLAKRSKREQKSYHIEKRLTWGSFNPVTRTKASAKAYDRNKEKRQFRNGELPFDLHIVMFNFDSNGFHIQNKISVFARLQNRIGILRLLVGYTVI